MSLTISMPRAFLSPLYLHMFCLLLIFITACSVLKEKSFFQSDSVQKQDSRLETNTKASTQLNSVHVYKYQDSAENQSSAEIFPDGVFTYSFKDGFSGSARRVVINDILKSGTKMTDSSSLKRADNTISKKNIQARLSTKVGQKEKTVHTDNYTVLYLMGVLLIFGVVFLFRWKLND